MKRLTGLLCLFPSGGSLPKHVLGRNGNNWLADQSIGGSFGVQVKEWQRTPEELDEIKAVGFGILR